MKAIATTQQGPSVIADMAVRFGMDRRAFEATLMATVMPAKVPVSQEQVAAFLLVAKKYNLNPFTKEIYAFPSKGGGIQPMVPIDGWMKIINEQEAFDGMEFVDQVDEKGKLSAITCRMFRKDRAHPTEVTEYMSECAGGSEPWRKWPARMLRHKAAIQAARYAFGLSGIVDPDEAERANVAAVDTRERRDPPKTLRAAITQTSRPEPVSESADDAAPDISAQEIHDAIANAKTAEALDEAAALITLLPTADQAPLFALHGERQKEFAE